MRRDDTEAHSACRDDFTVVDINPSGDALRWTPASTAPSTSDTGSSQNKRSAPGGAAHGIGDSKRMSLDAERGAAGLPPQLPSRKLSSR